MRNLLVIASLSVATPMIAVEAPSGCVQDMLPELLEQFLLCPVPTPFPEEIELIDFSLSDGADDDESAAATPTRPIDAASDAQDPVPAVVAGDGTGDLAAAARRAPRGAILTAVEVATAARPDALTRRRFA